MSLPLAGYVRVSRVGARKKGEGFISPDVQQAAIRGWCERNGHELLMLRDELNVSGGTMDRPVFNEIIEGVHSGKYGGLVVYKLDRFSRSLLGAIGTLTDLGEHGAVFASASEPTLDYSTPSGRAFMQQMFVFAEFTRATLKESWHTTQRYAVERGVHISPNGYLGYDKVKSLLVPNADAPIVVEVFQRRHDGQSWGTISGWLNSIGASRIEDRPWCPQAVRRLCAKRVYRGEASRYVGHDKDGRGPIVNKAAHPALVTEKMWLAAQVGPRTAPMPGDGHAAPLLAGLIRCAGCRFAMSKGRAIGGDGRQVSYQCRPNKSTGRCTCPTSILSVEIDAFVEAAILAELDKIVATPVDPSVERDAALAVLEQARADLDEFRSDTSARRKLGELWHDTLDGYLVAVRDAERAAEQVVGAADAMVAQMTSEHYLTLPIAERRDVLTGFIDCVMIRKVAKGRSTEPVENRARILWRGEAPSDLPRPRRASPVVAFDWDEVEVDAGVAAA